MVRICSWRLYEKPDKEIMVRYSNKRNASEILNGNSFNTKNKDKLTSRKCDISLKPFQAVNLVNVTYFHCELNPCQFIWCFWCLLFVFAKNCMKKNQKTKYFHVGIRKTHPSRIVYEDMDFKIVWSSTLYWKCFIWKAHHMSSKRISSVIIWMVNEILISHSQKRMQSINSWNCFQDKAHFYKCWACKNRADYILSLFCIV